jgi:hypothetical protein
MTPKVSTLIYVLFTLVCGNPMGLPARGTFDKLCISAGFIEGNF